MNHKNYMAKALSLAEKGIGSVSPNPAVGAVLVKNGHIIGEGYHRGPGNLHAEAEAIANATESVKGAVLYTTLEPCCSVYEGKRQPPCTESIIREGITGVYIAAPDPNPRVSGGGVQKLKEAGLLVTEGLLRDEAEKLNEIFKVNQIQKRPFVHLKIAQTLDGRIATNTGDSKWITDSDARRDVHRFRARYDAVLIGSGTAKADDPLLTVRLDGYDKKLIRIVLNSSLNLNSKLKLMNDQESNPTIIVTGPDQNPSLIRLYKDLGVRILEIPLNDYGRIDLTLLLRTLYEEGITSLFVEGGTDIFTSFIKDELYDRLSFYIAPVISGSGINSIGDLEINKMSDSHRFKRTEIEMINDQAVFHGWRV